MEAGRSAAFKVSNMQLRDLASAVHMMPKVAQCTYQVVRTWAHAICAHKEGADEQLISRWLARLLTGTMPWRVWLAEREHAATCCEL